MVLFFRTILHFFVVLMFLVGVSALGYITPKTQIVLAVGTTLEMNCTIDLKKTDGKNSSHLSFFTKFANGTKSFVPSENIEILNETSIRLKIEHVKPMLTHYYCWQEGDAVDMRLVSVGTEPKNVTDFKCRANNFDNFICKFKPPHNDVQPTYNLTYRIKEQIYNCSLTSNSFGYQVCNLSLENGNYRQVHEFYEFTLYAKNGLGENFQKFNINHFDSVIPAKPAIIVKNETSNSAILEWTIEKHTLYTRKSFRYDAKIMSEHSADQWTKLDLNKMKIHKNKHEYRVELTNLEFAFTWYDIRMRMKVASAEDSEDMWSEMANFTFRTLAKRPDRPPQTDIGSFHFDSNKNIHLFWKKLPKYAENGPNAHYNVSEIRLNGKRIDVEPEYIDMTTAKFNLSLGNYEFEVRSANALGLSNEASLIRVPLNRVPEPLRLKKIYNQYKYTLSWSAPVYDYDVYDYTVFWCISKSESFNQCEGPINFTHVSRDVRNFTHDTKEIVNFAISANSLDSSSGMVWAMCTALEDSDFGKMSAPSLTVINATTIKLVWSLECVYSSILQGYRLIYCPTTNPRDDTCNEPEKNVTISGDAKEYYLGGLKPYTTYKIIMSMFSDKKQGPPSDSKFVTTIEAPPSSPRNLKFQEGSVTNTSVILTWERPLHSNGRLRYYEISYNNEKARLEGDDVLDQEIIVYKLDRLRSFWHYKIYVVATGIADSPPSNDISLLTAIGTPGSTEQPISKEGGQMKISWLRPVVPSGRIEYYELQTKIIKNNVTEISRVSKINGTSCTLRQPVCQNDSDKYEFKVRAVNIEYDDGSLTQNTQDKTDESKYIELDNPSHSGDHDETTIFKRHSNPEINYSYENSPQRVHRNNHIRHNRQERENTKDQQYLNRHEVTTDREIYYECEEESDKNFNNFLQELSKKKHNVLSGDWSTPSVHWCHYRSANSRAILIGVGCMFFSGVICAVMFFGCKKYRKMKNIDVVFPAGLNDLVQESRSKGIDNVISKDDINRSDESLFKNEERHLLSGRIEAGYTHAVDLAEKIEGLDDDTISEHVREEDNSGQTDSVELSDMSDNSQISPSESPSINLRAKTANEHKPANKPIIINGYVQHSTFQKPPMPTTTNGYTQLDAFGKPILPHHISLENGKHKNINMINSPEESICGYVTHKQLSEFGHRLQ